jgi:hypothetical protein
MIIYEEKNSIFEENGNKMGTLGPAEQQANSDIHVRLLTHEQLTHEVYEEHLEV